MRAARIIIRKWKKKEDGLHRQEILDSVKWPNVQQLITASTLNLTKQAISGQSSCGMNYLLEEIGTQALGSTIGASQIGGKQPFRQMQ